MKGREYYVASNGPDQALTTIGRQAVECLRNLSGLMPQGPVRLLYCHNARKFRDQPDPANATDEGGSMIEDLLQVLRNGPTTAASAAARTLGNIACIDDGATALRACGADQGLLDAVGLDREPAIHEAAAGKEHLIPT